MKRFNSPSSCLGIGTFATRTRLRSSTSMKYTLPIVDERIDFSAHVEGIPGSNVCQSVHSFPLGDSRAVRGRSMDCHISSGTVPSRCEGPKSRGFGENHPHQAFFTGKTKRVQLDGTVPIEPDGCPIRRESDRTPADGRWFGRRRKRARWSSRCWRAWRRLWEPCLRF